MKLSLIAASIAALAVAACGTSDEARLSGVQAPSEPAVTPPPAPAAPPRTLITGTALPTSPVNLIADPGFGTLAGQAGFGSFLAFDELTFSQLEVKTTVDSRSPAGFGGAVALVVADGATSSKSDPVLFLTSFQGGAGPFHAKVWVSRSTVSGKPTELVVGNRGVKVTIADGTPDGSGFDLTAVEGSDRIAGDRTWTLVRGEITQPLPYGGFFVIHLGTGGGQLHVASPEIVAQPLLDGLVTTKSLKPSLHARSLTTMERSAIHRYHSAPPRLIPAASPLQTRTRIAD